MSSSPIPRTYALVLYGDMDVSIIKEKPSGRIDVKTSLYDMKHIKDALIVMYKELKNNHQVYVVSPIIEDDENELMDVYRLEEELGKAIKDKNIKVLHGKMKNDEKEKIMNDFKNNKINILISTTVIEVGVDVPNATGMVIFDADRFGLSTLHQLRGRVGRGESKSFCILISDSDTERLSIMERTTDGFEISEEDFKLRGHGDLFGTKQSGDMVFKIANIKSDYKILLQAKEDSEKFLLDDDPKNKELKDYLISTIERG
jgi:ATP-dependent DNA helicase RecG